MMYIDDQLVPPAIRRRRLWRGVRYALAITAATTALVAAVVWALA